MAPFLNNYPYFEKWPFILKMTPFLKNAPFIWKMTTFLKNDPFLKKLAVLINDPYFWKKITVRKNFLNPCNWTPKLRNTKSAALMAQQNAELDKMAENIARQAPKIYPKTAPSNTVVLTPVTTCQGTVLKKPILGSKNNLFFVNFIKKGFIKINNFYDFRESVKIVKSLRFSFLRDLRGRKEFYGFQVNRKTSLYANCQKI